MKKFLCLTTSLCAAVCALSFGGAAVAFADTDAVGEASASQFYPKDFETVPTFENLTDYAVGGDKFLFLENNELYEYGNERVSTYKNSKREITELYFDGEEFYYKTDEDNIYSLKNFNNLDAYEEDFTPVSVNTDNITSNGYNYYFNLTTGGLKVNNLSTDQIDSLDGFSQIKQYGENSPVYAVRTTEDNKQVLCTLSGTEHTDIKVKNFDLTENIAVGNAYSALTSSATNELQFVNLPNGDAYMTKVDLKELNNYSTTFTVGETVKVNTADMQTALLLYTETDGDEGISIIAIGKDSYLIHPDNTSSDKVYLPDDLNTEGTATAGFIYSVPFESAGTRIKALSGTVTILKEITQEDFNELDGDYYYVEYEAGEETIRGYVRHGLISTYIFNEDPPVSTPDPEATTEDMIKPVVLVILVLLLIAIAAGYLIYVGTSDKRKKKNSDSSGQDK